MVSCVADELCGSRYYILKIPLKCAGVNLAATGVFTTGGGNGSGSWPLKSKGYIVTRWMGRGLGNRSQGAKILLEAAESHPIETRLATS